MRTITLSVEMWQAIIDALRAKGQPSMLEHADSFERQLDQHAADQPMVSLELSDAVYLRSFNWARRELGLPPHAGLPTNRRI